MGSAVGRTVQQARRRARSDTLPAVPLVGVGPHRGAESWFDGVPDLSSHLWERVRPLDPFPNSYPQRFPNAPAAIGLAGLDHFDRWTAASRSHARLLDEELAETPGIRLPVVPGDRTHVYYQYCVYVPDRDEIVRRCIRRGVDIETLHVDVCTQLPLFADFQRAPAPCAAAAAGAVQVPMYASLTERQVRRVAYTLKAALRQPTRARSGPLPAGGVTEAQRREYRSDRGRGLA